MPRSVRGAVQRSNLFWRTLLRANYEKFTIKFKANLILHYAIAWVVDLVASLH